MKKNLIPGLLAVLSAGAVLASCASRDPNKIVEAPVIFWNRQPTDAANIVDRSVMTDVGFRHIYYVGFDAVQGGQLQGRMIVDYVRDQFARNTAWAQRIEAAGELKYGLLIGQIDHNDSAARTGGIRAALGTRPEATSNANTETAKEGSIDVTKSDGSTLNLRVREVASQEAKNTSGATWDATTAASIVQTWWNGQNRPDMIVSNNDGMAMAAVTQLPQTGDTLIPVFGYDSNADALERIRDDANKTTGAVLAGTINQNAPAQAAAILMVARNVLQGQTDPITSIVNKEDTGFGTIEPATFHYNAEDRALLVDNFQITAANVADYVGKTPQELSLTSVTKPADFNTTNNVFLNTYSNTDTFLNSTVIPLFNTYYTTFGINASRVDGDGNADSTVLDKITTRADAYLVNVIKTTAALSYLDKIYSLY